MTETFGIYEDVVGATLNISGGGCPSFQVDHMETLNDYIVLLRCTVLLRYPTIESIPLLFSPFDINVKEKYAPLS